MTLCTTSPSPSDWHKRTGLMQSHTKPAATLISWYPSNKWQTFWWTYTHTHKHYIFSLWYYTLEPTLLKSNHIKTINKAMQDLYTFLYVLHTRPTLRRRSCGHRRKATAHRLVPDATPLMTFHPVPNQPQPLDTNQPTNERLEKKQPPQHVAPKRTEQNRARSLARGNRTT